MRYRFISFALLFCLAACQSDRGAQSKSTPACTLGVRDAQRIDDALRLAATAAESERYAFSDSLIQEILPLLNACMDHMRCYRCHYQRSMNVWDSGQRDTAIAYMKGWLEAAASAPDSVQGYYHAVLGWFHFKKQDFEQARPVLEKAAAYLEACGRVEKLPGIYNNLGACLVRLGDYESAEHYLKAAIRLNSAKADSLRLALNFHNLGRSYNARNDGLQALHCFERAAALSGDKDADYHEGLAKAYFLLERWDKAREAIQNGRRCLKESEADPDEFAIFSQWSGQVELASGKPLIALKQFREALKLWRSTGDSSHYDYGKTLLFAGDALRNLHQPHAALDLYQRALRHFIPGFKSTEATVNPALSGLPNEIWVMEILYAKALAWEQCYRLCKTRPDSLLKRALEASEAAVMTMLHMKTLYQEDASKLYLDQYGSVLFFEKAIALSLELAEKTGDKKYEHRAFLAAQRSKAGILRNRILEKRALYHSNLPKDSMQKWMQLQYALAQYDQKIKAEADSAARVKDENQRFNLKRQALKWLKWADQQIPAAKMPEDLDVQSIQAMLPRDALLLEYFMGQTTLYAFAIDRNTGLAPFAIAVPEGFSALCRQFRRCVSDADCLRDSLKAAEQHYLKDAPILFKYLLEKPLNNSLQSFKRIYVAPDGPLVGLPFAALLTTAHQGSWNDLDLPVLIRTHALSYLYSSALFQAVPVSPDAGFDFGGFGADYRDDITLSALETPGMTHQSRSAAGTLDFADDEVRALAALTRGKGWLNQAATKTAFLQRSNQYNILHFALHTIPTKANPDELNLVFSRRKTGEDNLLSISELAALKCNASLAVLSACSSGYGSFQQGEGMMSLGRAFALAGCPSTLVNLWEAEDRTSHKIMLDFYPGLMAGLPKDEALRHAQLRYLEHCLSQESAPFYWANFALFGNADPVAVAR